MTHDAPTPTGLDSTSALRESEELYRLLVQNTTAIILRVDTQARITFANDRALRFFGYSSDDLIGQPAVGTIIPETESSGRDLAEMVREIAASPDRFHSNVNENIRKNGERVWLEWTNTGIYDDEGNLREFLAVGIDITERRKAETNVERLLALMDHNPCLVFLKDEDGKYVYLNEAYEKQFALSKDWYGRTDFDLWPRESAELFRANDASVLQSGRMQQFMEDSCGLDGKRYCWLCYKFPFTDSSGRTYVGGIGIDATARVLAEEALRQSEEALQHVVEYAPASIYEIDYAGPRFKRVNEAICRLSGYTREELLSMNPMDLLDDESKVRFQERASKVMAGEEIDSKVAFRVFPKHGRECWAELHMELIHTGGKPTGALVVAYDVTERERTERALRESEGLLRSVMEGTPDPVYVKDLDSRIIMCNEALAKVVGKPVQEIAGKTDAEYYEDSEVGRALREHDLRVMADGRSEVTEETVPTAEGDRTFLSTKSPRFDASGKIIGITGISRDVTDQKKAEQALRETEATRRVAEAVETERQRLFNMLETLPALICLLTPDYHVAFANRAFRKQFGESHGRPCYEYCLGFGEPCEFCETYNVLQTGRPHQWECTCPDGTIIAVYDFPFADTDGSPMILKMGLDVTQQRKDEAELARHREHLQDLVQERTTQLEDASIQLEAQISERELAEESLTNTTDYLENLIGYANAPIIVWEPSLVITRFNAAFERLTGYVAGYIVGKRLDVLFPRDTMASTMAEIERSAMEHWESVEIPILCTDGRIRVALWNSANIYGQDGALVATIAQGQDITERKKAEEALQAAKQVAEQESRLLQRALMPAAPPDVEGYSIASAYVPAFEGTEIGGDFVDVFMTESGKLGILIGDVSGKGIEAASIGATTRSTIHAFAYDMSSPGYALAHANSVLIAGQPEDTRFVTAFLMVLNPLTGDLTCSSAGHPAALLSAGDGAMHLLCSPNTPLGVTPGADYEESRHTLRPGEKIVLYTDGVTEARRGLDLFGTEGIEDVLSANRGADPGTFVRRIIGAAEDWAQGKLRDDTVVLVIQREA